MTPKTLGTWACANPRCSDSSLQSSAGGPFISVGQQQPESDLVLDRLSFSNALSTSVKLSLLEAELEAIIREIRDYPTVLINQKAQNRRQVLQMLGRLLAFRAHLNLHSGLLDATDMFWEDAQLEKYYLAIAAHLEVKKRISLLNQKLDYANETAVLLRDFLSEKHSLALEWCIIGLISVEVLLGTLHHVL